MNIEQQRNHAYSFFISLGILDLPDSVNNAKPVFVKRDTPPTREIFNCRNSYEKDKRKLLFFWIDVALKENILRCKDIWEYLLKKESDLGENILIRNKKGVLINERTFRDCVLERKNANNVIEISVREQILDLHRHKCSFEEIVLRAKCDRHYVKRCLSKAGIKVK